MLVEEAELHARLLAGDEAAFTTVVRAWSPAMLRVARLHVPSHAIAEEVVQEAWLGVVRAIGGFEGRAQLRTWAFSILVNIARRRGGQEARRPDAPAGPASGADRFPGDDDPGAGHRHDDPAAAGRGPEAALLAGEFRVALRRALADLPDRQRAVVELRDVHGMDADEVCAVLDLTQANQRVLLHRARARLRVALETAAS